jgi:uncharacterized protein
MRRLLTAAASLALMTGAGSAASSYTQADDRLSWAYESLLGVLSPAGRTALRNSERAWIATRNRACGFEAKNACATQWVNRRAEALEKRLGKIWTDPELVRVGQCFATSVERISTRLEDGAGRPIADSGSAVEYADGHYMVDYATSRAVGGWRAGDAVRLCVTGHRVERGRQPAHVRRGLTA